MIFDKINLIEGSINNNHVATNVTEAERLALSNVEIGEIVYQINNASGLYIYNGTTWNKSPLDADSNGTPIVYANSTNKISSTILPSNIAYIDNTTSKLDPSIIPAITFDSLSTKPTTLLGYGITDAINTDKLGVASGVATLNTSGQLTASQIPSSLASGLTFKGNWDATSAEPSTSGLLSGSYYIVSVAGTTSITTSTGTITDWKVSDWLIYNGTNWDKIDNTDTVTLGANVFTGNQTAPVFISNIATGTSPLTITSTTLVNNLNVESWNGTKLDSTTPTTNGMVLAYDTTLSKAKWIAAPSSTDASALTTGTLDAARLPAFTGDATSTTGTSALTLANSGVTAGTYKSITVNAKGLVTAGTNPTTLSGYGITDAINTDKLGVANGVATLNTSGQLTATQIPSSIASGLTFKGNWDATTAAPSTSGLNSGSYYIVSVAGTTSITTSVGAINSWAVGDWLIYNGTNWDKIDNTDLVSLGTNIFTGNQTAPVFISNVAQGTAPFTVTSTTKVANLNADLISGTKVTNSATAGGLLIGDATAGNAKWIASGDVTVDSTSAPTKTKVTALHNMNVAAPLAADDKKVLSYDNSTTSYKWITAGASTAADTSFTATGSISSTNVQAAIAELDTEKASLITPTITGLKEVRVSMPANAIDLALGNIFTKTISGATTLTVSNIPASGTAISFMLDLTNGGSAVVTWFSGVKWAGGTTPTLTSAGRDLLGFITHDGGTTWNGMVIAKDVK